MKNTKVMKYKNKINGDQFFTVGPPQFQFIDGVKYMSVFVTKNFDRTLLVRAESLEKVSAVS